MPIRTDKIYNKDTEQFINTENLLKFEPTDNTIRTLIDQILIKLDNIKGINLIEIDKTLEEWTKKIDDIQNEYEKLYNFLVNLADTDAVDKYLNKIEEITNKIEEIQNILESKLDDLKNSIDETQNNLDNYKEEINKKIDHVNKVI